jgi:hypothetical protein
MRKIGVLLLVLIAGLINAQNLELINGKDIKQPGKINPSLAGVQEDMIRIISDAEVGQSYQLMLEGKLPLKMGNYMVGVERLFNEDVVNNSFSITYNRKLKTESKKFNWRYGGSLQFNQRSLLSIPGYDSAAGYRYTDINGQLKSVPKLADLETSLSQFDMEIGASANYKNLLFAVGAENIVGQNVSFVKNEKRRMPFTGNVMLGGFVKMGEKVTLFPSLVSTLSDEAIYVKGGMDFTTEKFNISAAYLNADSKASLNAAVAIKYKKVFAGLKYTHPLSNIAINEVPGFNIFFNSTVFKSRSLFKSEFAKKMKKLY